MNFDEKKRSQSNSNNGFNIDPFDYMQNRELSWLTFNERVLDQGADESVPLLERLNFISIFWSNLQEFFMVRVGSLTDLSYIDPPVHDSKTGMTPKEQIRAVHERCSELYPIQESYYEHVRGSLAKQGVRHLRPEDISEEQKNYLFGLVKHNIEPFLSPQIINSRHPFPHLENGKLYILVRLNDEASEPVRKKKKKKKKGKGGAEGVLLGLIPLPHQCERIIKLPGRGFQFILLEHAIEMFVPEIFSMYKIKHTNVICVTRNADIDANQGFDEQDEDYREHMKRLLKQRARLAPVRLECERPLSPVMEKMMQRKLGLKRYQIYDTTVPLDLSFTWGLGSRLNDATRERLTNKPFTPAWPICFNNNERIIDQVAKKETLVFYPYESMDPFVQLLREASADPDVLSIKITLYRLASKSHLAEALIAAADAGKEVTALFELRARFDENNNIEWSQRFEEAGCHVIYGFRDYKVHSKICCITRQTEEGLQYITQLGTGNYNESTAKLYTDLSFITTDEAFARDATEFFRNMQLENVSDQYEVLRVAPLQIKPMILDNLDKQIALARAGKPASAFLKANSVTDKEVIEKISEASNAGVQITLFVRGICCLVPQIAHATENVRVVSIVGRLLEHSRIYCFGANSEDVVIYLSSADLMTRNLNKRIEIAWPVLDKELKGKILDYIQTCLIDSAKLRELRPNATYTPLGAFCGVDENGIAEPAFDSQNQLILDAEARLKEYKEQEAEEAEKKNLNSAENSQLDEPLTTDESLLHEDSSVSVNAQDQNLSFEDQSNEEMFATDSELINDEDDGHEHNAFEVMLDILKDKLQEIQSMPHMEVDSDISSAHNLDRFYIDDDLSESHSIKIDISESDEEPENADTDTFNESETPQHEPEIVDKELLEELTNVEKTIQEEFSQVEEMLQHEYRKVEEAYQEELSQFEDLTKDIKDLGCNNDHIEFVPSLYMNNIASKTPADTPKNPSDSEEESLDEVSEVGEAVQDDVLPVESSQVEEPGSDVDGAEPYEGESEEEHEADEPGCDGSIEIVEISDEYEVEVEDKEQEQLSQVDSSQVEEPGSDVDDADMEDAESADAEQVGEAVQDDVLPVESSQVEEPGSDVNDAGMNEGESADTEQVGEAVQDDVLPVESSQVEEPESDVDDAGLEEDESEDAEQVGEAVQDDVLPVESSQVEEPGSDVDDAEPYEGESEEEHEADEPENDGSIEIVEDAETNKGEAKVISQDGLLQVKAELQRELWQDEEPHSAGVGAGGIEEGSTESRLYDEVVEPIGIIGGASREDENKPNAEKHSSESNADASENSASSTNPAADDSAPQQSIEEESFEELDKEAIESRMQSFDAADKSKPVIVLPYAGDENEIDEGSKSKIKSDIHNDNNQTPKEKSHVHKPIEIDTEAIFEKINSLEGLADKDIDKLIEEEIRKYINDSE